MKKGAIFDLDGTMIDTEAWHIWLDDAGYRCEVHLCKDCFKEYEQSET